MRRLWLDNDYFGQILSLRYKHSRGLLTVGGGWNRYNGKHFGEVTWAQAGFPVNFRWYDLRSKKTDVNAYAKYEYRIATGLQLFGDLQYRDVVYNLGGFRDNPTLFINNHYHFVNPKLGITYNFDRTRMYASYAFASKEPNRDDFEAGAEQQPAPEKMHDIEAGIETKFNRYSWSANVYYMKYRDQLIPTGKINDVGAYTRINIPDSYRAGIELQGSVTIAKWLAFSANLALSRNKVQNFTEYYDDYDNGGQKSVYRGSTDIAFSPSVTGGAGISIEPFENARIALLSKYVSRQYLDNTSMKSRSLDPYYVQDARVSYSLPNRLFKSTDLILQVNNVFNKKYEANGYTFSYLYDGSLTTENFYFPMAGTNFMFAVNIGL